MGSKLYNDSLLGTIRTTVQDSKNTVSQPTDDTSSFHQVISFKHQDSSLQAFLYFDDDTSLWIIDYLSCEKLISSALYQSQSTAYLMLQSLGYKQALVTAC